MSYYAGGYIKKRTLPEGTSVNYAWNAGRLTNMIYTASNKNAASYGYLHDANGNITNIRGLDEKIRYKYDYQNRLTNAEYFDNSSTLLLAEAFWYDAAGNITNYQRGETMTRMQYDIDDKLTNSGGLRLEWDNAGRLVKIISNETAIEEYSYNLLESVTNIIIKKGAQFVKKNGSNFVYIKNHQGSVEGIVSGGKLLGTNRYTAYGDNRTNVGNTESDFGYTGREEIQGTATGMYYYRSRLYSTRLMSFMREDDYYKGLMQTQSEKGLESGNWYQYVAGNPVMNNDPMGFWKHIAGSWFMAEKGDSQWKLAEDLSGNGENWKNFDNAYMDAENMPAGHIVNTGTIEENIETAKKMNPYEWYNAVRNKGMWDYKQKNSELQDFGNYNYGVTGKEVTGFGLSDEILKRGAGWANRKASPERTKQYGEWYKEPPHGDDPKDQEQIQKGIEYKIKYDIANKMIEEEEDRRDQKEIKVKDKEKYLRIDSKDKKKKF